MCARGESSTRADGLTEAGINVTTLKTRGDEIVDYYDAHAHKGESLIDQVDGELPTSKEVGFLIQRPNLHHRPLSRG